MDEENSAFKKLEGDMLWQYHGREIHRMDNPATVGDIKKGIENSERTKEVGEGSERTKEVGERSE